MPAKPKKTVKRPAQKTSEVEELRQRLSEAKEQRHLLIQALHGMATNAAPNQNLMARISKPDLDAIIAWLVQELESLTKTRPIDRGSSLTDLKVPLLRLTKDVNDKWFPNGGGFPPIAGSTIVGDLAF